MGLSSSDHRRQRHAGFTLVEAAFVVAILSGVAVVLGQISMSTTSSVDYLVKDTRSDVQISKAMKKIVAELRLSATTVLTVNTSDPDRDALTAQTPNSFSGTVAWGALDQQGVWRSGWSVQYLVAEDQLVRRVLDSTGSPSGTDEAIVLEIDAALDGVKGFQVVQNGPVVNLTIRTRQLLRDNNEHVKQLESSVYLKNG